MHTITSGPEDTTLMDGSNITFQGLIFFLISFFTIRKTQLNMTRRQEVVGQTACCFLALGTVGTLSHSYHIIWGRQSCS